MLVPIPRFQELRKYNEELLVKCNEDGNREHYRKADFISKLFEEDKKNFYRCLQQSLIQQDII